MTELTYTKGFINCTRDELTETVKQALSDERFAHCQRVEATAIQLAEQHHEDVERASIGGLLHDYAKESKRAELEKYCDHPDYKQEWQNWGRAIWHGPLAAMKAQRHLGLTDEEIYWAIYDHTVGTFHWTPTAKIIAIADYIEPERDFPGVDEVRHLAMHSLDDAIAFKLKHELAYLIDAEKPVYPQTFAVYNYWQQTHQKG
ncbi:MAG: bis(5'-nucleosyl)-tetraphosphatase (symmetrical) YqeK [Aerococcus sp.]|nr:bis(5'-nucleosyl)-tetraphosphatase (symmetrical) YqeK [Aerococcus sp.]